MTSMSGAARRHGWLELLQQSGPFLTIPVADQVWPAGLPAVPTDVRAVVRAEVARLLETSGRTRADLAAVLFGNALGWSDALVDASGIPASLAEVVDEHRVVVRPDFAFFDRNSDEDETADIFDDDSDEDDLEEEGADGDHDPETTIASRPAHTPWRLLGMWTSWGHHPLMRTVDAGWAASPVERLAALLRARDVPIGVVSDGRWWAVVWAPRGRPVGAAVWDAALWSEEPETFAAFVALLARRRFLGVTADERLPALLDRSSEAQEEVTVALGGQVRAAVEMLVDRLDELDRQADGAILNGVSDDDLYAGVVTIMMRVLFLLFAEERRLLPSDDDRYDRGYSVGRLVEQLEQRAAIHGEQTLEHRSGAWHRLLAVARALHQGVAHEDLRLPPYGGDLFDPDRYPWLEDRNGRPPPVDDLTVLRMLQAVQYVHLRGERRRLTFRALDVEQIGYVYEGLLELEVRTATEPIVKLRQQGKKGITFVGLSEAILATADLEEWVASTYVGENKATAPRRKAAARWLSKEVVPVTVAGLRQTLGAEGDQLEPLASLLRCDDRDRPLVTRVSGRYVAPSTRRATTGAHYTPRSLAEEIVRHALEPLVFRPGPLDTLDSGQWVLRPSTDLLALRVADIAMGSGAFLVAACRYLADRVIEAWDTEGDLEASRALTHRTDGTPDAEVESVVLRARRLVAEHCLYGVDVNPLAVEMAKLSLWLVTMDRERPFGFLDDRFVCGDSLLGLTSLAQLDTLHIDPGTARQHRHGAFDLTAEWRRTLARVADTRRRITATPVVTVRDVEHKTRLLAEAQADAKPLQLVADALTGAGLRAASQPASQRRVVFGGLEEGIWALNNGDDTAVLDRYASDVDAGLPPGKECRRPLHWPLVFPELFADTPNPGFDTVIGNPPFLGGQKISAALGSDYLAWLAVWDGDGKKGSCDLAARFVLRADALLRSGGQLGYVTTNTLVEGDTLSVGLLQLEQRGWAVRRGTTAHPWPSTSVSLSIVEIWATKGPVATDAVLDGEPVPHLSVDLQPYLRETGRPEQLRENEGLAFQGSNVLGLGFTMEPAEAEALIAEDSHNADVLFPYVIGADLNRRPDCSASRWIINFRDWPLERAEQYPTLIERVRTLVKPERDRNKRATRRDRWWWYAERAPELYDAIAPLDHVLAISLVGNTLMPARVPTGQVFAHACGVFAFDDFASLSVLSSSAHQTWVIRYTSTMRTDIRYAPSDVFLTFPRPVATSQMEEFGEALDAERREVMLGRALGLTKLYNQVHDPAVTDPEILRLRGLHEQIDYGVLAAYGWDDLDPEVGHHQTKIGMRWTVSPRVRFELLDRLLVENHRRAAAQ
jgi:hypothetical protein